MPLYTYLCHFVTQNYPHPCNCQVKKLKFIADRAAQHVCLIGVGVGIGIGVEKTADQRPIPMPIATLTPKDTVVLIFYGIITFGISHGEIKWWI
jgi:hypothetical protein